MICLSLSLTHTSVCLLVPTMIVTELSAHSTNLQTDTTYCSSAVYQSGVHFYKGQQAAATLTLKKNGQATVCGYVFHFRGLLR